MDSRGPAPDRRMRLQEACVAHAVEAVYLFGSRTDDGARVREGGGADTAGSDLDVGVFFGSAALDVPKLAALQVALEDVFEPLRVDLVPLDRVDALFQFHAVDGFRVYVRDSGLVDRWELMVMRRGGAAADPTPDRT